MKKKKTQKYIELGLDDKPDKYSGDQVYHFDQIRWVPTVCIGLETVRSINGHACGSPLKYRRPVTELKTEKLSKKIFESIKRFKTKNNRYYPVSILEEALKKSESTKRKLKFELDECDSDVPSTPIDMGRLIIKLRQLQSKNDNPFYMSDRIGKLEDKLDSIILILMRHIGGSK